MSTSMGIVPGVARAVVRYSDGRQEAYGGYAGGLGAGGGSNAGSEVGVTLVGAGGGPESLVLWWE